MTGLTRLWFAAFIVAVFFAGTSAGVIVDRLWLLDRRPQASSPIAVASGRGPAAEMQASRLVEANLGRLQNRLGLTDDQYDDVRPILEAWQQRVADLQANTRAQLLTETIRFEDEVSAVLTEEQRSRLSAARSVLLVPTLGRGRFAGPEGRGGPGRGGPGRAGPGRGGVGRE